MSGAVQQVGLLYPGEMGAALAQVLRCGGMDVATTLVGRSGATIERATGAGMVVLDSLEALVRQSDVVFSLVPPAAAEQVAATYCELAHLSPPRAIFVEMNSVSPDLAASIARQVSATGRSFVDGAINGLARNLSASGTMFLSGERSDEIGVLFRDSVRVEVIGDEPGRASAMKMLLSGMSKGVCGLFVELALVARRHEMLPELTQQLSRIYPGIWQLIERMLPTYSQHAGRRATEMCELEETARQCRVEPGVIKAIRLVHEAIAASEVPLPLESPAKRADMTAV